MFFHNLLANHVCGFSISYIYYNLFSIKKSIKKGKIIKQGEKIAEARGRREAYNSEPINNTENKILELNKYITQPEIAKILNLSENCIYKNLKILKNKNLISRIGANKNGYWEIRDNVRDKEINFDEIMKEVI